MVNNGIFDEVNDINVVCYVFSVDRVSARSIKKATY